jgi:hypothetical protein
MATTNEIIIGIIIAINGLALIGAGLMLYRVAGMLIRGEVSRKNNMGIGFKIKEAYASDEAWYRINREGGKQMILSSQALAALGVLIVLFGVLVALFGFELRFLFLVPTVALAAIFLILLVPSCWYVIRVKRNERKRKAS